MAKNEYGVALDCNGYAPSIVQPDADESCWLCGVTVGKLDRHEIFFGPYREKSKRLGLWATLCHESCHLGYGPFGSEAVHAHRPTDLRLKQAAQRAAMMQYGWDTKTFIAQFGRNYLEE